MGIIFQTIFKHLSDKEYLNLYWLKKFRSRPDFDNPATFNAKLQWLKLYYHPAALGTMVDKATAKDYAAAIIGTEHIIPTFCVADSWSGIHWDALPESFVMKPTHWGGGRHIVICPDKKAVREEKARRVITSVMDRNLFDAYREWPFKSIRPRIIVEQYLGDSLTDYKFFCFGGKAEYIMLCVDRFKDKKFFFFDRQWTFCRFDDYSLTLPPEFTLEKPENIDAMWEMADKLSQGQPFVRVDLYNTGGKLYFGEFTFYPCSGFDTTLTPLAETTLGNMITLPEKTT